MTAASALPDPVRREYLADWVCQPFARWATVPPGYQFPRALVEWLLNPPHPWFLGHHCERCGLGVPLRVLDSRDPAPPPPNIVVFAACPGCGGPTRSWPTPRPGRPHEHPPAG